MSVIRFKRQPKWLRALLAIFRKEPVRMFGDAPEVPKSAYYDPKQFHRRPK
jgi:hypothetical protein